MQRRRGCQDPTARRNRRVFTEIVQDLQHLFLLGLLSPRRDRLQNGGWRKISVRVPRHKDFRVRAKEGYCPDPPSGRIGNKPRHGSTRSPRSYRGCCRLTRHTLSAVSPSPN